MFTMLKKSTIVICAAVSSMALALTPVHAEDPDYTDTDYWNKLCTQTENLTSEQQASCSAYISYVASNNSSLKAQIDAANAKKADIEKNVESYATQLSDYSTQISSLNDMISDLQSQISSLNTQAEDLQSQIDAAQVQIDQKQTEIDELKQKVATRMEQQQETMRLNSYFDVLTGTRSLTDLVRILNGLADISEHDDTTLEELDTAVSDLNTMQESLQTQMDQLKETQDNLSTGMEALDSQQASLLAAQYQTQLIKDTYMTQMNATNDDLNALLEKAAASQTAAQATASPDSGSTNSSSTSSTAKPIAGYSTPDTTGGKNPYYGGWANCTWGCWQLVYETLGVSLPWFPGNAGNWLAAAQALGYSTGSEPAVNSIYVNSHHVAFVTAVDGNMIYVKEGNYLGRYHEGWISKTYDGCIGYIYL